MNCNIVRRLVNKAVKSRARYKISALGLNKKGDIIDIAVNCYNFPRKQGGIHAEEQLMKKHGYSLQTIIICRTSKSGDKLLPIHPCTKCQKLAKKYNIKIMPLHEII